MKNILIPGIILLLLISAYMYFLPQSLNSKLDKLEIIIDKYEPKFDSVKYGSEEYVKMIQEYNKEIFEWGEDFELARYKRDDKNRTLFDENNKPMVNPEFSGDVEKRFYELNNRMTKMVLSNMPVKKDPSDVKKTEEKNDKE